uniref:Acetate kinase n=1 Tax=uncultured Thiotrichaceae bacterium TaxID=298394 RepID=A0A6S6UJU0_9GAMM|nr:MAG: Acetate kinase (EC [uncultured Thiotrichaceae bacterium]
MSEALLTLNAGSSSLKFAVFTRSEGGELLALLQGQLAGIGHEAEFSTDSLSNSDNHPAPVKIRLSDMPDHATAIQYTLAWLNQHLGGLKLIAAGHRIVHGGQYFTEPQRIDAAVIQQLEQLIPLAPHHQPHHLSAIKALAEQQPDLPQVACFDTAFHSTQPDVATRLPIPQHYAEQGIRRYGFHGLSYEYITRQLQQEAGGVAEKVVIAHLGNGASLCALHNGRSIATSMGFSTLDGLMMGSRCGTLDPGVILHWMQSDGLNADDITDILYNQSGLKGISGLSTDMRVLLNSEEPAASAAVEQFCYTLVRQIGSHVAALQGINMLVFTGGIGEHSAIIRQRVCEQLAWLGIQLDTAANDKHDTVISARNSLVTVRVIPTNEEQIIARHTLELLA